MPAQLSVVRTRAIELASQPDMLQQPLQSFEGVEGAKLEADAHLNICISQLAETLVTSVDHRQRFMTQFSAKITDEFADTPNTKINRKQALSIFDMCLTGTYRDLNAVAQIIDGSPLGLRTQEACKQYVNVCDNLELPQKTTINGAPISYRDYLGGKKPIVNGLNTFFHFASITTDHASGMKVSPEERARRLVLSDKGMRKIASLTPNQANMASTLRVDKNEKGIDVAADLEKLRKLPKHAGFDSLTRPHLRCPALPIMPETPLTHSGSAISKLWAMTTELVVATNLHALDSDDEAYRIVGDSYDTDVREVA
ncbi:MAG: hypothetical protein AAB462_02210 [Patescibacteria group bacterium]